MQALPVISSTYPNILLSCYLIIDINRLERNQHCATKYILNNFTTDYRQRLIKLNLLPLMY